MLRTARLLPSATRGGITRRGFLRAGALGALGCSLANSAHGQPQPPKPFSSEKACILIFNYGAPSQLDTWDPKPGAPCEVRGPFRPIATKGDFQISELLPMHAAVADKFSIIRSVHHGAAAMHEAGCQLMQTGRLSANGVRSPHVGCVQEFLRGRRDGIPAHVILPEPLSGDGADVSFGQDAGFLGANYAPFVPGLSSPENSAAFDLGREPLKVRERYGMNRLGQSALLARRLVERGVRFVTLNAFTSLAGAATWDIHGSEPFTTIADMRDIVAPMYDRAISALIEDLQQRGMLDTTLVACLAEFGRTPWINTDGGRDHWTHCSSAVFAGGGVNGGRAIGASDEIGAFPSERPVTPQEIIATIHHSLGLDPRTEIPGPDGSPVPLVDSGIQPIAELF